MSNKTIQESMDDNLNLASFKLTPDQQIIAQAYTEEYQKWTKQLNSVYKELAVAKNNLDGILKELQAQDYLVKELKHYDLVNSSKKSFNWLNKIFNKKKANNDLQNTSVIKTKLESAELKYSLLQSRYNQSEKEFNIINKQFDNIKNSPPPLFRYELAILGNNIFSVSK